MATPVIMPRQGQSVESCIFSEWYVKTGEKVSKGDLLFAYETDKAAFEGEAPEDGTLLAVFAEPGDAVPVLENIAVIGEPGEDVEQFRPGEQDAVAGQDPNVRDTPPAEAAASEIAGTATNILATPSDITGTAFDTPQPQQGSIKISPRAKKAAEGHHIHHASISGTGPEGRIIERDILNKIKDLPRATPLAKSISFENHIDLPITGSGAHGKVVAEDVKHSLSSAKGPAFEEIKVSNIRRIIAENMHASLSNTAQLTLHASADARKMQTLRKKYKKAAEEGTKPNITINDLACYAVVKALDKHPAMNAHFLGNTIRQFRDVHLGFAVDTERGLMVPTLRNANHLTLEALATQMKELAAQAQSGKIDPELLSGATFTITNLGAFGIEMFTPVLNPPQTGILGLNTITLHPSPLEDGSFGFIPKIGLSLTFDHRAIDGAPAAAFLRDVSNEINNLEIL